MPKSQAFSVLEPMNVHQTKLPLKRSVEPHFGQRGCSIGEGTEKACDFGIGIHRNITRSEATVLWWKSLDIGQRLTDDQIAMFRGNAPAEEVKPKVDGPITVEIVEATEHRPERVALGFYNVDHHIDFEQSVSLQQFRP